MKVGMTFYSSNAFHPIPLDSLKYVAKSMTDAITSRHELVFMPPEHTYAADADVVRMTEEFVRSCDVIVGCPTGRFAAVRQRIGSNVPMVGFLLGVLPRGGWGLDTQVRHMTTNDVLLANCTADLELAGKFLSNAQTRLLPFAVDDRVFYPVDEAERKAIREKLGLREEDRVLVYVGRVTLQKNLHTLLKVFSAVQTLVPDACLVIVGPMLDQGSLEFGVTPLNLGNTVRKLIAKLRIPEGRVHLVNQAGPALVRELYNVADVKVNMTLHHDENFGLTQVEAMACGTPVVGTAWGGLKDTILDGVSGYKVTTASTRSGVKVNWWEAVNRIVALLRDPEARERFRESCVRYATERYSQARYEATLLEILDESVAGREKPAEPLRATSFAEDVWTTCNPFGADTPPFLRGPRSYELYQELMAPVTEATREHVPADEAPAPGHVLSLASPIVGDPESGFRIDDPMYPFDLDVPEEYRDAFGAVLPVLREAPAITVERLGRAVPAGVPNLPEALGWMLSAGLLLRSQPVDGWVAPEEIDSRLSEPLFRIERLDRMNTDFIMY